MNTKLKVKKIMLANPNAAKYGKELMIQFMQQSGMNLSEHQKRVFRDMEDLWTVRRTAQKLVETGEVKLDEETMDYRFERYKEETARHSVSEKDRLASMGYVLEDD